jgi:lactate dehydrogenase-like 2-hydroxyacid dehydrogenase
MKPEILVVVPGRPLVVEQLQKDFVLHRLDLSDDPEALLAQVGDRVQAIVTNGELGASGELIRRLPRLEIIGCFGVGVDAIDLEAARSRNIPVTNTPEVLTDDVADMGLMLTLATLRRLVPNDRHVRERRWEREGPAPLSTRAKGRWLGIVGMGRIGLALARRAETLGMNVVYHNRKKRSDVKYNHYSDLVAMARAVDVLALCCPGGEATRGLVDAGVLEALGPEGHLVNIARGSVVDEPALVEALEQKRIAGAGLDVFAFEPRVPEALLGLDNVVLSPHAASATVGTRDAMGQLVVDNIRAHFRGDALLTPFL